jgi:heme-degrading monooxygenase HmoA
MYARVVSLSIQPEMMDEAIRIFREDINPVAKEQKGLTGGSLLTDKETGKAISISLWETEADMVAGEENEYLQEQVAKVAYLLTAHPITAHYEVSVD